MEPFPLISIPVTGPKKLYSCIKSYGSLSLGKQADIKAPPCRDWKSELVAKGVLKLILLHFIWDHMLLYQIHMALDCWGKRMTIEF